jgi:hypothetical protein
MASLSEILAVQVAARVVSRTAANSQSLLNFFGFQPTVADPDAFKGNDLPRGSRRVRLKQDSYDVYNNVRVAATGRAPEAPAATVKLNPVGRVPYTLARMNEKIVIPLDRITQQRVIGGSTIDVDNVDSDYVKKQFVSLAQRAVNHRVLLLMGMLRGMLYGHAVGDTVYYDFTSAGAIFNIDYKMPSGNQTDLNINGSGAVIAASWATASTDIPGHVATLRAQISQLYGGDIEVAMCSGKTFVKIVENDNIRALAGSANVPVIYGQIEFESGKNWDGSTIKLRMATATFPAIPWLTWIISDAGMFVGAPGSETWVAVFPEGKVWFGPKPSPEFFEMLIGPETIVEKPGGAPSMRYGLYAWSMYTGDPAAVQCYIVDNCLPANYIPAASCWATVYTP